LTANRLIDTDKNLTVHNSINASNRAHNTQQLPTFGLVASDDNGRESEVGSYSTAPETTRPNEGRRRKPRF